MPTREQDVEAALSGPTPWGRDLSLPDVPTLAPKGQVPQAWRDLFNTWITWRTAQMPEAPDPRDPQFGEKAAAASPPISLVAPRSIYGWVKPGGMFLENAEMETHAEAAAHLFTPSEAAASRGAGRIDALSQALEAGLVRISSTRAGEFEMRPTHHVHFMHRPDDVARQTAMQWLANHKGGAGYVLDVENMRGTLTISKRFASWDDIMAFLRAMAPRGE